MTDLFPDIQQRIPACQAEIIPVEGKKQAAVAYVMRDLASEPKCFLSRGQT